MLVFALSGCSFSSAPTVNHTAHADTKTSTSTETPAFSKQPLSVAATPIRLLIPTIGINAAIESLGTLADGNMATPTQSPWEDVGWYNAGPRPGEKGSAVIDGHLDKPGGYPAVFWRLRNIQPGSEVKVQSTDGKTLSFHVTRIALYQPQDAPIQDIFGNRSGNYLNLITCAGDWIPSQHQTTLRLVVYTALS